MQTIEERRATVRKSLTERRKRLKLAICCIDCAAKMPSSKYWRCFKCRNKRNIREINRKAMVAEELHGKE